MSADADKPLHGHSDCGVHRDCQEDLSDGKEPGNHVRQNVNSKVQGEKLTAKEDVYKQDTDSVRYEEERQHASEYRLQFQVLLSQYEKCQQITF